ncbi:MAG: Uma2 family endonuclease [Anaerolineae bacterium]|nr:Uma2 family endonuclease [Anaerolineae bacterium]
MLRERTLTLADYRRISDSPENSGRLLELIDGEIVEKIGSFTPSQIALELAWLLKNFLAQNRLGYLTGEGGGYIMSAEQSIIFIPDIAFISYERLPHLPEREAPIPPDFAVEIKSPSDRVRDLRKKAERYIEYGTRLVWLILPETRQIEVYTPSADVLVFGIDDTLTGGDVLPGFSVAVRGIFPEPPQS